MGCNGMLLKNGELVFDTMAIAAILMKLASELARNIKKPSANDFGVFLPGWPSSDGMVHKNHALAAGEKGNKA